MNEEYRIVTTRSTSRKVYSDYSVALSRARALSEDGLVRLQARDTDERPPKNRWRTVDRFLGGEYVYQR